MSTTVDERVVSMQFDNRNFEKNVATSMTTLDKLKQSLNFKDSVKSLGAINDAANKVDMSSIASSAETIGSRFSALEVMAVTALANITNSAVNTGKQLVKSLSVDQIMGGWNKYEQKTSSVQTIMNSTGKSIDEVSAYLDKLMWYSDETSYGFTDMTASLAQLTSAGGDIDKLIPMIEGIANATAFAGKGANEFSRAIYNLNQSYSAGYLQYMDWRSLDLAGVASKQLKETLISTAEELGKIQKGQVTLGNFAQTLKDKWADTEVMEKAFGKFSKLTEAAYKAVEAGEYDTASEAIAALSSQYDELAVKAFTSAQEAKSFTEAIEATKDAVSSGWMRTSEVIFGDYQEAKVIWTDLANTLWDVFASGADARNELLNNALNISGLEVLSSEGLFDTAGYEKYIQSVAKEHNVAFDKMIEEEGSFEKALQKALGSGEISSDMLSEALNRLTGKYEGLSEEQLKNLGYTKDQVDALVKLNKSIQNGSSSMSDFADKMSKLSGKELILKSISNIWKALLSVVTPIKEAFREIFPKTTSDQLYNIIEAFKNFTSKLILSEEASEKLKQTFKGMFAVLDIVWTVIKTVVGAVFDLFDAFTSLSDMILSITAYFTKTIMGIRKFVKETKLLSKISKTIVSAISGMINGIRDFSKALSEKFETSGFDGFIGIIKFVWTITKTIFEKIANLIGATFDGDADIFEFFNSLLNILNAGLLTTFIMKLKSFSQTFEEVGEIFGGVIESLTGPLQGFQDKLKAEAISSIAKALLMIAGALLIVSLIEKDKMEGAISAIATSLGILIGALALLGKGSKLFSKASGIMKLVGMASALLILSFALKMLGDMSWNEIAKGLTTMTGALAVMLGALYVISLISKDSKTLKQGTNQLKSIAFSLLMIAAPLKIISTMSWEGIAKGLTGITAALAVMVGALYLMSKISSSKKMSQTGAGLLVKMSFSLLIVSTSLKLLSTISWDGVARGLTAMGGAFAIMVGTLAILSTISSRKQMAQKGAGLLIALSFALLTASVSLKLLSTMSWDGVARGLTAMGGAFVIMVGALAILSNMSSGGKLIAASAAILILSASLSLLVPTLMILGNMGIGTIITGLVTIAATLIIFGVAAKLLQGAVPAMLGMAAAILIFGAGVFLLTTGIGILLTGLAALITSIATFVSVLVAGGSVAVTLIVELVEKIITLIPLLLKKIGEGIIAFCEVITEGAPAIAKSIEAVILSLLEVLVRITPVLVDALLNMLLETLRALETYLPKIVDSLIKLIIGVIYAVSDNLSGIVGALVDLLISAIYAIAEHLPKLIKAGIEVFAIFFDGLTEELKNMDSSTIETALMGVGLISALMVALGAIVPLIPPAMLGVLLLGALIAELALVLAAIGALTEIPGLMDLIEGGGNVLQAIGTALGQFVGGIIGGLAKGVTSVLPGVGADLSSFMTNLTPFIAGIKLITPEMIDQCKTLSTLLLTITGAGLVESLIGWGTNVLPNVASDLSSFMTNILPFIIGLRLIDETLLTNAENLASLLLIVTGTSIIESLTSWFNGGVKMEDFANELIAYGNGIKGFAEAVNGVDGGSVEKAAQAGKTMIDIVKALPKSGGLKQIFSGEQDASTFGEQLKGLGDGIKNFSESVQGVSAEYIISIINAAKILFNTLNSLPTISVDMSNFSTQMLHLSAGIIILFRSMPSSEQVSNVATNLKALANAISEFSKSGIDSIANSVKDSRINLAAVISTMVQQAIVILELGVIQFKIVGMNLVSAILEAVLTGTPIVALAFNNMVSQAVSSVKSIENYNKTFSAGSYLVEGLSNGIRSKTPSVISQAISLATTVANAISGALQINSPSKLTIKDGESIGEGLVVGLSNYDDKVSKAGYDIADSAMTGLSDALVKTSELIENGIDSQPTIKPVLDLSDVEAGANHINGMFDMSPSVGVLSRVGSINSSMNKNQNGSDDMASIIKDLKNTLQNNTGNVYNFGDFTYSSGDEIDEAVQALIRAVRIGGRK